MRSCRGRKKPPEQNRPRLRISRSALSCVQFCTFLVTRCSILPPSLPPSTSSIHPSSGREREPLSRSITKKGAATRVSQMHFSFSSSTLPFSEFGTRRPWHLCHHIYTARYSDMISRLSPPETSTNRTKCLCTEIG